MRIKIFLVAALCALLLLPPLQAVQAQDGSVSGTGNELICRNAGRDWTSFLSAVISYDDFVEYFRDITGWPPLFINSRYSANMCLFLDIDNLLNQIKKVRTQIRQAFYACDANVEKLKKTYFRLEAELFFLRKFVNLSDGKLLPVNDQEVLRQLHSYFVLDKNFLQPEELKGLFEQFKNKYDSRLQTYANCSDPTWENLLAKIEELKAHVSNGMGIKQSAQKISSGFEKALDTPYSRTGNLLGGFLDFKINDLDPLLGLSDLGERLKEEFPNGYTFEQLQAAEKEELTRYDEAISRETYLAHYDVLYRQSTGSMLTTMLDRLTYLQDTIKDTFNPMNQTVQCTKGIVDKAC